MIYPYTGGRQDKHKRITPQRQLYDATQKLVFDRLVLDALVRGFESENGTSQFESNVLPQGYMVPPAFIWASKSARTENSSYSAIFAADCAAAVAESTDRWGGIPSTKTGYSVANAIAERIEKVWRRRRSATAFVGRGDAPKVVGFFAAHNA